MIKKAISLILCAVLLFCFCSCGKADETPENSKEKREAKKVKEYVWKDYPEVESESFKIESQPAYRDLNYYESQIAAFEAKPVEEGKILFYGASNFTRWSTAWGNPSLESVLTSSSGERVCVNHGFGGATLHEMCYYYERAVKPWKPKVFVTSLSANGGEFYSTTQMMQYIQWLCSHVRKDFPGIKIFISGSAPHLSDSTSNIEWRKKLNEMLIAYAKAHDDVTYIDLAHERLYYMDDESAQNGTFTDLNRAIYADDGKHLNAEGYKKYAEVFKKYLKDYLT